MKKIIVLGCFALLAAVGCKKTTNVYYVDPNQPNGNPGNTYTGPVNDTLLCGETTIDSSQYEYDPVKKRFKTVFTQADRNEPNFVCYIVDIELSDGTHPTPAIVEGGATLQHFNNPNGFDIVLFNSDGTIPWIPQYVSIKVYVVIEHE
jgi:hypothetical protein